MDKRVSISVLSGLTFLLVFNTVSAQYQGYKPVNDIANFKKIFATESAKVMSITSDFTQNNRSFPRSGEWSEKIREGPST